LSVLAFKNTYKTSKLISVFVLFLFTGTYFINPIIHKESTFYSLVDLSFENETENNSEESKKLNTLEDLFLKNQNSIFVFNYNSTNSSFLFEFLPEKPILKIPIPPPELA
jgi:hypothetical protein